MTWSQLKARIEERERETRDLPNDEYALTLTVGELRALARAERWSGSDAGGREGNTEAAEGMG